MRTIWELKQALDERRDLVARGARFKKAEWIEFLEDLASEAASLEDHVHQDCYSLDSIDDFVSDRIEQIDRDREEELQRLSAEEHRARFGVLNGGAA